MDSKELYNEAYRLHYSQANYENALTIYEKVIKQYPDSKEAEYASKQIENINNMSAVEKQKNLANRIAIAKAKDKLIDIEVNNEIKDTHTPQIKNKEKLGFFSFRTLITPDIVKILYVLGFIALTIVGFVMMVNYYETYELFIGLGVILVGNILWRLLCEGIILMFNVHEILDSIEKKIK
jgi:tetratricopeptide (TPR) repeat protein